MQFLKSKSKSALAVTGLTILVVVSSLWLDEKKSLPDTADATPDQSKQADYFMENYKITSTDINGKAYRWLSGEKFEHLPNGDTNLTQPKLRFREKDQHWLLFAENGSIQENKHVTLDGNVNIQQLSEQSSKFNIQTEHLDISINENRASTKNRVTISDKNGEINAVGMDINFDKHQLRLLSQVKGRYVFEQNLFE